MKTFKAIKIILSLVPLLWIIVFFFPETYVEFWSISWNLLIIIMFLRPLRDIFPKLKFLDYWVKLRKELWIIVWIFWLAHVVWFFLWLWMFVEFLSNPTMWDYKWYLFWWVLAFIVSIPLVITSNLFSIKLLGKNWKKLQALAYLMFFFTLIHVAFIKKDEMWWTLSIWFIYIAIFVLAWYLNKKRLANSKSNKYLCVPCGWIYDEELWDPDWWIAPWTKWEDIPDTWKCPVCWVGKEDFEQIKRLKAEDDSIESNIKSIEILNKNKDVIELSLETKKEVIVKAGQFITFILKDNSWEFRRSYSVSESKNNELKFLIKIKKDWRWWKIFEKMKAWDKIKIKWAFWNFVLKETDAKKVFIASGTGLSPVYNMLKNINNDEEKILFFWLKENNDVFYLEQLQKISWLKTYVCLSREDNLLDDLDKIKFLKWRINLDNSLKELNLDKNTEFYICWNPWLVEETTQTLKNNWFTEIFKEVF